MSAMQNNAGAALLHAPVRHRIHPLMAAAAVAVILLCGVGVASMTGLLPNAFSHASPSAQGGDDTTPATDMHVPPPPPLARSADKAPAHLLAAPCTTCGTVESVRSVEVKGQGTGLGAVAGGVTGAVVGHQIGNGNGNVAMTILGAAGGAFAGNEIEKNVKKHYSYRVTVRMDDGTYRTISQANPPSVAVGEKVRVANGTVVARS